MFKKSHIKAHKNLKVIMIVASESNGVIGNENGSLPWNCPEDMKWFRKNTLNSTIIMGRKTFESIGKPLPKRHNIVLTRQKDYTLNNVDVVHSIDEAFSVCQNNSTVFICGGAEIYKLFEPFADLIYHTEINLTIEDPTGLPKFSDPANSLDWMEAYRFAGESERPSCEFVIYSRCRY